MSIFVFQRRGYCIGMGMAVTFVIAISSVITYIVHITLVLGDRIYASTAFILVIKDIGSID